MPPALIDQADTRASAATAHAMMPCCGRMHAGARAYICFAAYIARRATRLMPPCLARYMLLPLRYAAILRYAAD